MVQNCCIKSCNSKSRKDCGNSYHKFPSDRIIRQQWLDALNINSKILINNKDSRVCSKHFESTSFIFGGNVRRLKKVAIPKLGYPVEVKRKANFLIPMSNSEGNSFIKKSLKSSQEHATRYRARKQAIETADILQKLLSSQSSASVILNQDPVDVNSLGLPANIDEILNHPGPSRIDNIVITDMHEKNLSLNNNSINISSGEESAGGARNSLVVQDDVHQQQSSQLKTTNKQKQPWKINKKRIPKTAAQRMKEYRARKKAQAIQQQLLSNQSSTTALPNQDQVDLNLLSQPSNIFKHPEKSRNNTNIVVDQEHFAPLKSTSQQNQANKRKRRKNSSEILPKTGAQRTRDYRARQIMRLAAEKILRDLQRSTEGDTRETDPFCYGRNSDAEDREVQAKFDEFCQSLIKREATAYREDEESPMEDLNQYIVKTEPIEFVEENHPMEDQLNPTELTKYVKQEKNPLDDFESNQHFIPVNTDSTVYIKQEPCLSDINEINHLHNISTQTTSVWENMKSLQDENKRLKYENGTMKQDILKLRRILEEISVKFSGGQSHFVDTLNT